MTNNSIFTRVLAIMLCVIMLASTMTSCFGNTENDNGVTPPVVNPPIVDDEGGNDNTGNEGAGNEEEKDPSLVASATIGEGALIYGALANEIVLGTSDSYNATLPADVKIAEGASSVALSVKEVETGREIVLGEGDVAHSLDVHIDGIAADNTVPMIVNLGAIIEAGLDATSLKLYHTENGVAVLMTRVNELTDFAIHNQYYYNAETGEVSIYVASFSVISAVQTTASKWDENTVADTSWYDAEKTEFTLEDVADFLGFRDLVDAGTTFEGKTVILGVDIDLADKPFDPIGFGYYDDDDSDGKTNYRVFMGTFDGAGHTIYNLYENCWELDPDKTNYSTYTYSTAGAGLFASIKDATIKNLAISGAEIVFECVDMGIVVGYAQGTCHFENIIVTDSNIANYNRYTGGVVGEVSYGPYGIDKTLGYSHTFKNVTVDSTVKVSGLWGSFGCGMGGVIGGKWGDATVKMENVVSAAEMDVYNDVVSAYQWYAFRGCGMLIGHTEEPYSDGRHSGNATASFLTCQNVMVYYGDWVNYHYYEFENQENTTGQRYPWVRAEAGEYCDAFSNIRYGVPTHGGVKVSDLSEENLMAVATDYTPIVFDQLYGADRGMYGTATHDGVTVHYNADTKAKTIYILNNEDLEGLKLYYWYKNGEDTWSNIEEAISMDGMLLAGYNVYKLDFPCYVDGFEITYYGCEESVKFTLADLTDGATYSVTGDEHEHSFDNEGKCDCGAYKTQIWELVTDSSALTVGDKIIIVATNSNVALGTTQNNNNRGQATVAKNGNTVTIDVDVQIITLESGNADGTFAFNVGDGYLYAASSSSNHLRTEASLSDNSSWKIEIADNIATITAQGTNTRNWLRYNSTSSLFSCYGSGSDQQDVSIYKLASGDDIMEAHDCNEFATGATCEDNATCGKCGKEVLDTALGHDYDSVVTEPTCIEAGFTKHTCSRCKDSYKDNEVEALGHNFIEGICSRCETEDSSAIDFSGRYYIAAIRTSGNYFYMTSDLGTASTNRYQAVDSGLTVLPTSITTPESGYVFVLIDNGDGTYSIQAEGVDSNNYLGWTSGNSGTLVAEAGALELTVEITDGVYNIHFAASDAERYLALNGTSNNNYFAWYKSGQKQDLVLIPVEDSGSGETPEPDCEHTNTTETTVDANCTEPGSVTVTCDDCGDTVSTEVIEALGHNYVEGSCTVCGGEDPDYNAGSGDEGGEDTTIKTFVKVTETPTDWSGTYLIVYEDGSVAFNGSLDTLDATSNTVSVTINNGVIECTDTLRNSTFTIDTNGYIKSNSGYYIGQTSNANGLKSNKTTQYTNTISINADGTVNIVSGGAYLRYNATSGQERFRYYKSSSYTQQKAITLYKLVEG